MKFYVTDCEYTSAYTQADAVHSYTLATRTHLVIVTTAKVQRYKGTITSLLKDVT